MSDRLDDLRGLGSTRPPPRSHPWVDAVLFAIGTVVVISQLLAAFAGRPFDGFEPVFDWELGSWGWLGRAVFIAGWLGIIAQSLRPQSRAWDPRAR